MAGAEEQTQLLASVRAVRDQLCDDGRYGWTQPDHQGIALAQPYQTVLFRRAKGQCSITHRAPARHPPGPQIPSTALHTH